MTPQPPNLANLLRTALRSQPDGWDESVLHASDLGVPETGCMRQLKLRLQGAEKRPDHDGELLMFAQGHNLQDWADDLLRSILPKEAPGWTLELWEVDLSGFLPATVQRGSLDRVLIHQETDTAIPVDYKSLRGKAFGYLDLEGPKLANVRQVQGYCMALERKLGGWKVPAGKLFYVDREGQNFARDFDVERDDEAVLRAAHALAEVEASPELPPVLEPVIRVTTNKGPDSIRLGRPWQCEWCRYSDISCPSALPPEHRDLGIIAKVDDAGKVKPSAATGAAAICELYDIEGKLKERTT